MRLAKSAWKTVKHARAESGL
eukprot:COSAG03_NODE_24159_length_274_cov_0.880000_1_plen_20_part_01